MVKNLVEPEFFMLQLLQLVHFWVEHVETTKVRFSSPPWRSEECAHTCHPHVLSQPRCVTWRWGDDEGSKGGKLLSGWWFGTMEFE